MARVEEVSIPAPGAVLAGRLFRPPGRAAAAMVLNGATGVPARFYAAFAEWAAERGIACLIWDYRDFAASGSPRGSSATMTDWGVHDQQAARDWLATAIPDAPLWVLGHSLGGMMLPYQTGLAGIERVILVACGAVNVHDHPWPYQAFARAFWSWPMRATARGFGYLPLRALRLGHDIPAGVYRQWRDWCVSLRFQADDPDLPPPDADALTCPMRVVAAADDALCPPAAAWRMMAAYPMAWKRQVVLRPDAFALDRIGHLDMLGVKGRTCWRTVLGP